MSGLDGNPFGNPIDNPFADPSIQQAAARPQTHATSNVLEGYNPFADESRRPATAVRGASNPPVVTATNEPPPAYSASGAQQFNSQPTRNLPGHEDLLRRQEELEAKAAELKRREEELTRQQVQSGVAAKNWPPLPKWFPVGPCFYQDINVEIPTQFQAMVRQIYYIWLLYAATLILNVFGSLAYFIAGGSGTQFGFAIIQGALLTPCSFLFWYRPVYKAFRNDSSFNFMIFFFVMFLQLIFITIQSLGISSFGTCGWFNTIGEFGSNVFVALIMFIITIGFTVSGVGMLFSLFKVHRTYRSTGASFAKAQQEFSQGIINNPNVQSAAVNVAASAAANQMSSGRY